MSHKIPDDAFAYYVSLQEERSYEAVAKFYGVSRRAVTKAAARENWSERLEKIERDARERADKKLAEAVSEVHMRHRKMLQGMAGRAVKAIAEYPLTSGMEGMRAAEIVIKLERLIAGEPTERVDVAGTIKRECQTLLLKPGEEEDWNDDDSDAAETDEADPGAASE